jgi:FlaA1/EpsC-like NDP-sugar epimerase
VAPIFKEQIKRGGPVRITHADMERFFMSPSEAVLLVMQAAAIGKGGMTYVLDMGKPVRILDLAKELIRLSGLEPDKDIPILFTRPRSGEKMSEELFDEDEKSEPTKHNKIFETKTRMNLSKKDFLTMVDDLIEIAENGESDEKLREFLWKIIG